MIHERVKRFYHRVAEYLWKKDRHTVEEERSIHLKFVDTETERLAKQYEAAYKRAIIMRDHPSRYNLMHPSDSREGVWYETYDDDDDPEMRKWRFGRKK